MADNGKKEFPIDGYEQDSTSKIGRRIHCYLRNGKGVTKSIKQKMNKRFRKRARLELKMKGFASQNTTK